MGSEGAPYGRSDPNGEIPTLPLNIFERGQRRRGKEELGLLRKPFDVLANVTCGLRRGPSLGRSLPQESEGSEAPCGCAQARFLELLDRSGTERLGFSM